MQSVTWVNGTQQAHHAHTVVVGRRCPVVRSKHHTFEPTLRTHHDAHWTFGTSFVFQRLHTAIGDAKFGQGKHFSTENFLHFIGAQHAADRSMWKNNPKEGRAQTRALLVSVELLVLVASDFHIEFYTLSDLGNGYMTFWLVLRKNL